MSRFRDIGAGSAGFYALVICDISHGGVFLAGDRKLGLRSVSGSKAA